MKKIAATLGLVTAFYLIARAIVEPFVIDFGDPASYADDWGGPSLAGVLAVHVGPGLVSLLILVLLVLRSRRRHRNR